MRLFNFLSKKNPRIKGLTKEVDTIRRNRNANRKLSYSFTPEWHMMDFRIQSNGYFDERPMLIFTLTSMIGFIGLCVALIFGAGTWALLFLIPFFASWGMVFYHIPIKTGKHDESESKSYGFYIYSHVKWKPMTLVLCFGKKTIHLDFPWEWEWVRTSNLMNDLTWVHTVKGNIIDTYSEEFRNKLWSEEYDYTYINNESDIQYVTAKINVVEREWRWKALTWLKYPRKISKVIDVEFSEGIGNGRGSYKGGTTGCSYEMLPNESPLETLRRMEKERIFR